MILRIACAALLLHGFASAQLERITPPTSPPAVLSTQQATDLRAAFERATFSTPAGTMLPYRMLRPNQATRGRLYPLVIMLHGSGQIGTDNNAQLDQLALSWAQPSMQMQYPAFVAAPQFPARTANYDVSADDHLLASHAAAPLLPLFDLIDTLTSSLPVDPGRIYLVGFSMGASGAWQSLLLHPEKFAAGLLLSGVPPERMLAPRFRELPLLIAHGDADPENPYGPDLAMAKALGPSSKTRFRTYTGMAHTVPPDIADPGSTWWRDWLFAQHR